MAREEHSGSIYIRSSRSEIQVEDWQRLICIRQRPPARTDSAGNEVLSGKDRRYPTTRLTPVCRVSRTGRSEGLAEVFAGTFRKYISIYTFRYQSSFQKNDTFDTPSTGRPKASDCRSFNFHPSTVTRFSSDSYKGERDKTGQWSKTVSREKFKFSTHFRIGL